MSATKRWYVYLLECKDGSIYTGVAIDVDARFAAHCAGKGARYTRSHPPSRILASEAFADQATALRAEIRIKKLTAAAKRDFVTSLLGAPSAAARRKIVASI